MKDFGRIRMDISRTSYTPEGKNQKRWWWQAYIIGLADGCEIA